MKKTSTVTFAAAAALLSTSIAADASWRCPSLYGAYYPSVIRCYDWQFDPNGPAEQAAADAQRQAIATRLEQERQAAQAQHAAELARLDAQREIIKTRQLEVAQEKAENSPDNLCRDPKIAGQLMSEFNHMDWSQPRQAIDIEHLVTIATEPLSCHGIWVLAHNEHIEGTMSFKKNVADEMIVGFHPGTWQPPLPPMPDRPIAAFPDKSSVPASAIPLLPLDTAAFHDGMSDRIAWEQWFNGLSGGERDGALYWASQRSLAHPGNCATGGAQAVGCLEAKDRLTPSDVRRKNEPNYRAGWNSVNAS
jgi:hypothetical protein